MTMAIYRVRINIQENVQIMSNERIGDEIPEQLSIQDHITYFVIVYKWFKFSWRFILRSGFAMIWVVLAFRIIYGLLLAIFSGIPMTDGDIVSILFTISFSGFVLLLNITFLPILIRWVNRTYITVAPDKIKVRCFPIPWLWYRTIRTSDIKRLEIDKKVRMSRNRWDIDKNMRLKRKRIGGLNTYEVHAILHDEQNTTLISELQTGKQAIYIKETIEDYLDIRQD